jgi:hypothetical protein
MTDTPSNQSAETDDPPEPGYPGAGSTESRPPEAFGDLDQPEPVFDAVDWSGRIVVGGVALAFVGGLIWLMTRPGPPVSRGSTAWLDHLASGFVTMVDFMTGAILALTLLLAITTLSRRQGRRNLRQKGRAVTARWFGGSTR